MKTAAEAALKAAEAAGAVLVRIEITGLMEHVVDTSLHGTHSRHDISAFLASRPNTPAGSLEEIRASGTAAGEP